MKNLMIGAVLLAVVGYAGGLVFNEYAPADVKINVAQYTSGNHVTESAAEQSQHKQFVCGKQIMQLPEDGNAFYVTVYAQPGNDTVVNWFKKDPRLSQLKAQTHFAVYRTNDPMYARYARTISNRVPAVVVTDPYGRSIYNSTKTGMPQSASALASAIQGNITATCPLLRRNRNNHDQVAPDPEPTPDGDDESLDGQGTPEIADADPLAGLPFMLAGICALIGAGFGVGTSYYEQYYKQV